MGTRVPDSVGHQPPANEDEAQAPVPSPAPTSPPRPNPLPPHPDLGRGTGAQPGLTAGEKRPLSERSGGGREARATGACEPRGNQRGRGRVSARVCPRANIGSGAGGGVKHPFKQPKGGKETLNSVDRSSQKSWPALKGLLASLPIGIQSEKAPPWAPGVLAWPSAPAHRGDCRLAESPLTCPQSRNKLPLSPLLFTRPFTHL